MLINKIALAVLVCLVLGEFLVIFCKVTFPMKSILVSNVVHLHSNSIKTA